MREVATKTRIPLPEAQVYAADLVELLAPACEQIQVAGSIRRMRPDVGDVELLCIPKFATVKGVNSLFGEEPTTVNLLDDRCDAYRDDGILHDRLDKHDRPAWGSRFKRALYRGFPVDIFIVLPPSQWGLALVIRTGPADFSHQLVTPKTQGFRDTRGEYRTGLLPPWLQVREFGIHHGDELVPTPGELDVFTALELDYIKPWNRQ